MIRLLRLMRRFVLFTALAGAVYVFLRFEVRPAPPWIGASPLAGDAEHSIVVDRRPRPLVGGDTVLLRTADGALRQGRLVTLAPERLRVADDGGAERDVLREDLAGRVVMTFGQ